jgi:NMD protein affecting ribosome stability and mRNA decay
MVKVNRAGEKYQRDKRVEERTPFRHSEKYRNGTRCPDCGLVFTGSVWKKPEPTTEVESPSKPCPACLLVRDGKIGGMVQLSGDFASLHRQDLMNRIRNVERLSSVERPLERIIRIDEKDEGISVSVTTEHLAARIGKAIQRDYGGTLHLKYAPEEKYAVARWHRDL